MDLRSRTDSRLVELLSECKLAQLRTEIASTFQRDAIFNFDIEAARSNLGKSSEVRLDLPDHNE